MRHRVSPSSIASLAGGFRPRPFFHTPQAHLLWQVVHSALLALLMTRKGALVLLCGS